MMKPLLIVTFLMLSTVLDARTINGFTLQDGVIKADQVLLGGPPRDGIPAIDHPRFVKANETELSDSARVIGIYRNGVAKAYPIAILNYHEIVNDTFENESIAVTFCPLCGTGMSFKMPQDINRFGVSGLLYNSDVLLYDRTTETLWSQIKKQAVIGPRQGESLKLIDSLHTTWKHWRTLYRQSLVLSFDTGFERDYSRNPYAGYGDSSNTYFPVAHIDRRYHAKEQTLGIVDQGIAYAFPFTELAQAKQPIKYALGDRLINTHFDPRSVTAWARESDGSILPSVVAFWFAWAAFHPDTKVYKIN